MIPCHELHGDCSRDSEESPIATHFVSRKENHLEPVSRRETLTGAPGVLRGGLAVVATKDTSLFD